MKILHIGHGFIPWRRGGSIDNIESIMKIQARNGIEVNYFFSGRVYPLLNELKLKKWEKDSVNMYEVINSPLIPLQKNGIANPLQYVDNKIIENLFRKVVDEINPDIVHIQELISLPSSLIDIVKDEFNIPIILTAHDYSIFCPTVKLFKYNINCIEKNIGIECCKCCYNSLNKNNVLIRATLAYYIEKLHFPIYKFYYLFDKLINKLINSPNSLKKHHSCKDNFFLKDSYQERRNFNIKRLKKVDLILTYSNGQRKIFNNFLDIDKITTINPAADHLKYIKTKKKTKMDYPIRFGTLNGCSSIEKGSDLILETIEILNERIESNKYEFHIWGNINKEDYYKVLKYKNIFYHGVYGKNDLNQILENIDVGIVPSVWEEVFGFVGLEFLKKGIPVIGNKKGGIPDYVIQNTTGWLNESATTEELVSIILGIIENPENIIELNSNIINMEFKTLEENFNEINELYVSLLKNR